MITIHTLNHVCPRCGGWSKHPIRHASFPHKTHCDLRLRYKRQRQKKHHVPRVKP